MGKKGGKNERDEKGKDRGGEGRRPPIDISGCANAWMVQR